MSDPARFRSLPLDAIGVGERFRPYSAAHAEKLTVSFQDYGSTAPIIVRPDPAAEGRFLLVAGMHRLEGARAAGLVAIDAEVRDLTEAEAREVEVAENAHRYDLHALDRSRSMAELARLHEARHGATPLGRPRKNAATMAGLTAATVAGVFASRFSQDARARTGLSERSIQRDIQIARDLAPGVAALLSGTPLAASTSKLLAISKLPPRDQLRVASLLASGEARTLDAARQSAGLPVKPKRADDPAHQQELLYTDLTTAWDAASPAIRARFREYLRLVYPNEPAT